MIGYLPTSLSINNIDRAIRSDFRVALSILVAYNSEELSEQEKTSVLLECLYENLEEISVEDIQEAIIKASLFLDGRLEEINEQPKSNEKKVLDWEQDEQMIFSAINKIAVCEVRSLPYLHWWTFLGYFNEISEGLLSTVISIRSKINKSKKLEKYENDFYRSHKCMIEIKPKDTVEEKAERDRLEKIVGIVR